MKAEIFKDCLKAPGLFLISNYGNIFSKRTNKILKLNSINGYPGHITKIGGRQGTNLVIKSHIEVAKVFVENPDPINFNIVNHLDANKMNPRWDNLEWTNHQGNVNHAKEMGIYRESARKRYFDIVSGDKRKISEEMIRYIALEIGVRSANSLANELGIDKGTIIYTLERWFKYQRFKRQ